MSSFATETNKTAVPSGPQEQVEGVGAGGATGGEEQTKEQMIAAIMAVIRANSTTTPERRHIGKTGVEEVRKGVVNALITAAFTKDGSRGKVLDQTEEKALEEKNANEHGKDGYDALMVKAGLPALVAYLDAQFGSSSCQALLVGVTEEQRAEIACRAKAEAEEATATCAVGLLKSADFMTRLDEIRSFLLYVCIACDVLGVERIMVGGNALGRCIPAVGPDFVDTATCGEVCPFVGEKAKAVFDIARELGLRLLVPNRSKGLGIGGVWAAQILYNDSTLEESWDWSGSQLVQYVRRGGSVIRLATFEYVGDDVLLKAGAGESA